jgi:hypothetical protein
MCIVPPRVVQLPRYEVPAGAKEGRAVEGLGGVEFELDMRE